MGGREAHDDSISEIHCGRCRDRLYYGGGQTDPYFATQPVSGAEGSGGDAVGRSPCLARKSRDLPVRSLLFSAYEASAGEQVRMLTRKAVNARRKRSAVLYVYGIDDILSVQKSVRRMDRDRLSKNTIPWASVAACELHPKSIGMLPLWHLSPLCKKLVNAFLFWIQTDGQADCFDAIIVSECSGRREAEIARPNRRRFLKSAGEDACAVRDARGAEAARRACLPV